MITSTILPPFYPERKRPAILSNAANKAIGMFAEILDRIARLV